MLTILSAGINEKSPFVFIFWKTDVQLDAKIRPKDEEIQNLLLKNFSRLLKKFSRPLENVSSTLEKVLRTLEKVSRPLEKAPRMLTNVVSEL